MTDFDCDINTAKKRFLNLLSEVTITELDKIFYEKIFYFLWKDLDNMLEAQGATEEQILEINNSFFGDGLQTYDMVQQNFHVIYENEKPYGHLIHTQNGFTITTTILEAL